MRGRGGISDCLTTVQGYYTLAGASSYISTPCSPGYFCLAGSNTPTQFACPPGTYRNLPQGASPTECVPCPSWILLFNSNCQSDQLPNGILLPNWNSKARVMPRRHIFQCIKPI